MIFSIHTCAGILLNCSNRLHFFVLSFLVDGSACRNLIPRLMKRLVCVISVQYSDTLVEHFR